MKSFQKEKAFEENTNRLRNQFKEMPLGVLLVIQGLIVEAAGQKVEEEKRG